MNVARFLTSTAVIERRASSDSYAGNTYSAPEIVPARWHDEARVVRADNARDITSSSHVTLMTLVSVGDRVTDPLGRAREIVLVRRNESTRGVFSHYVGYLA